MSRVQSIGDVYGITRRLSHALPPTYTATTTLTTQAPVYTSFSFYT